ASQLGCHDRDPAPRPDPPPALALGRETVRVDLEPARPRERAATVRWTSTTEVVRIETATPSPAPRPERVVLTVTQLTQAVKGVLSEGFRRVLVRGGGGNFRGLHPSGPLFFKLKDPARSHPRTLWANGVQGPRALAG